MASNRRKLGTLYAEFEIQFPDFKKGIAKAQTEAKQYGQQIEQAIKGTKLHLSPTVDLSQLHALNREFDRKQAHHRQVQAEFDRKPLTPKVDFRQLDELEQRLDRISRRSRNVVTTATTSTSASATTGSSGASSDTRRQEAKAIGEQIGDEVAKAIRKGVRKGDIGSIFSGILSAPFKVAGNVLAETGKGIVYGITQQVSANLGKGLSSALEQSISKSFGSTELIGEKVGTAIGSSVTQGVSKATSGIPDAIEKAINNIQDRKLRDKLKVQFDILKKVPDQIMESTVSTLGGSQTITQEGLYQRGIRAREQKRKIPVAQDQSADEWRQTLRERDRIRAMAAQRTEANRRAVEEIQPQMQLAYAMVDVRKMQFEPVKSLVDSQNQRIEDFRQLKETASPQQKQTQEYKKLEAEISKLLAERKELATLRKSVAQFKQAQSLLAKNDAGQLQKMLAGFEADFKSTNNDSSRFNADLIRDKLKILEKAQSVVAGGDLDAMQKRMAELEEIVPDNQVLSSYANRLITASNEARGYAEQIEVYKQRQVIANKAVAEADRKVKTSYNRMGIVTPKGVGPQAYLDLVQQVKPGIDPSRVPQLRIADQELAKVGALSQYDPARNAIEVTRKTYEAIKNGTLSNDQIKTLLEELYHAVDFDFGSYKGIQASKGNTVVGKPVVATNEELAQIAPELGLYDPKRRMIELNAKVQATRQMDQVMAAQRQQKILTVAPTLASNAGAIQNRQQRFDVQVAEARKVASQFGIEIDDFLAKYKNFFDTVKQKIESASQSILDAISSADSISEIDISSFDEVAAKMAGYWQNIEMVSTKLSDEVEKAVRKAKDTDPNYDAWENRVRPVRKGLPRQHPMRMVSDEFLDPKFDAWSYAGWEQGPGVLAKNAPPPPSGMARVSNAARNAGAKVGEIVKTVSEANEKVGQALQVTVKAAQGIFKRARDASEAMAKVIESAPTGEFVKAMSMAAHGLGLVAGATYKIVKVTLEGAEAIALDMIPLGHTGKKLLKKAAPLIAGPVAYMAATNYLPGGHEVGHALTSFGEMALSPISRNVAGHLTTQAGESIAHLPQALGIRTAVSGLVDSFINQAVQQTTRLIATGGAAIVGGNFITQTATRPIKALAERMSQKRSQPQLQETRIPLALQEQEKVPVGIEPVAPHSKPGALKNAQNKFKQIRNAIFRQEQELSEIASITVPKPEGQKITKEQVKAAAQKAGEVTGQVAGMVARSAQEAVIEAKRIEKAFATLYSGLKSAVEKNDYGRVEAYSQELQQMSVKAQETINSLIEQARQSGESSFGSDVLATLGGVKGRLSQRSKSADRFVEKYKQSRAESGDDIKAQALRTDVIDPSVQAFKKAIQASINKLNRLTAFLADIEASEKLGETVKKAALSDRGKDLMVNTAGTIASIAASPHGQVAGMGADITAALTARQALEAGIAAYKAYSRLQQTEVFNSANALKKLSAVINELIQEINSANFSNIQKDALFSDLTGFTVGNIAAMATQHTVPGVGAVAANVTTPHLKKMRDMANSKNLTPEETGENLKAQNMGYGFNTGFGGFGSGFGVYDPNANKPLDPIKVYQAIAKKVAILSNVSTPALDKLPRLEYGPPEMQQAGLSAAYNSYSNVIQITQDLANALSGTLQDLHDPRNQEQISVLIHELRHAFQFNMGQTHIEDLIKGVAPGVQLTDQSQIMDALKPAIEHSVNALPIFRDRIAAAYPDLDESGIDNFVKKIKEITRAIESDAYQFQSLSSMPIISSVITGIQGKPGDYVKDDSLGENLKAQRMLDFRRKGLNPNNKNLNDAEKAHIEYIIKLLNHATAASDQYDAAVKQMVKNVNAGYAEAAQGIEGIVNPNAEEIGKHIEAKIKMMQELLSELDKTVASRDAEAIKAASERAKANQEFKEAYAELLNLSPERRVTKQDLRKLQEAYPNADPAVAIYGNIAMQGRRPPGGGGPNDPNDPILPSPFDLDIPEMPKEPGFISKLLEAAKGDFDDLLGTLGKFWKIIGLIGAGIGVLIATPIIQWFSGIASSATDAGAKLEAIATKFDFNFGSDGVRQLEAVTDTAVKFRQDINATRDSYLQFATAVKGTALEPQTENFSNAISRAALVQGLPGEQLDRANTAMIQIAGKGRVYAEEVFGQLAEAMPNAPAVMGRALGTDIAGLRAKMKQGLSAESVLPKFFAQLEAESTVGASKAINTTTAAMQNLSNQIQLLAEQSGKALLPIAKLGLNTLAKGAELAGAAIGPLSNLVGGVLLGAVAKLAVEYNLLNIAMLKNLMTGRLLALTQSGLTGAWQGFAKIMSSSANSFAGWTVAALGAIEIGKMIAAVFGSTGTAASEFAKESKKAFADYKQAAENAKNVKPPELINKNSRTDTQESLLGRTFLGGIFSQEQLSGFERNTLQRQGMQMGFEKLGDQYSTRPLTFGELQAQKNVIDQGTLSANADNIGTAFAELFQSGDLEKATGIRKRIEAIQLERQLMPTEGLTDAQKKRRGELMSLEKDLVAERTKLELVPRTLLATNAAAIEGYKKLRDEAAKNMDFGNVEFYSSIISELTGKQQILGEIMEGVTKSVERLNSEFAKVGNRLGEVNQAIEMTGNQARTNLSAEILSGGMTAAQAEYSKMAISQNEIRGRIEGITAAIAQSYAVLNDPETQRILQGAGFNNESLPSDIKFAADNAKDSTEKERLQQAADQITSIRGNRTELSSLQSQLKDAEVQATEKLRDLAKSIYDFYRGIQVSAIEIQTQTKSLLLQSSAASAQNRLKSALIGFQESFTNDFVDALINLIDTLNKPLQQAIDAQQQIANAQQTYFQQLQQAYQLQNQMPSAEQVAALGGGVPMGAPGMQGQGQAQGQPGSGGMAAAQSRSARQAQGTGQPVPMTPEQMAASYNELTRIAPDKALEFSGKGLEAARNQAAFNYQQQLANIQGQQGIQASIASFEREMQMSNAAYALTRANRQMRQTGIGLGRSVEDLQLQGMAQTPDVQLRGQLNGLFRQYQDQLRSFDEFGRGLNQTIEQQMMVRDQIVSGGLPEEFKQFLPQINETISNAQSELLKLNQNVAEFGKAYEQAVAEQRRLAELARKDRKFAAEMKVKDETAALRQQKIAMFRAQGKGDIANDLEFSGRIEDVFIVFQKKIEDLDISSRNNPEEKAKAEELKRLYEAQRDAALATIKAEEDRRIRQNQFAYRQQSFSLQSQLLGSQSSALGVQAVTSDLRNIQSRAMQDTGVSDTETAMKLLELRSSAVQLQSSFESTMKSLYDMQAAGTITAQQFMQLSGVVQQNAQIQSALNKNAEELARRQAEERRREEARVRAIQNASARTVSDRITDLAGQGDLASVFNAAFANQALAFQDALNFGFTDNGIGKQTTVTADTFQDLTTSSGGNYSEMVKKLDQLIAVTKQQNGLLSRPNLTVNSIDGVGQAASIYSDLSSNSAMSAGF